MLIFDQLKKNDPHLRCLTVSVLIGLLVLASGLWWVQIVSARDYRANLESQSFRTTRIPAVRGRILDRTGAVLADSRPNYIVSLYLEELRKRFEAAAAVKISRARKDLQQRLEAEQQKLGRKLTKEERKPFTFTSAAKTQLRKEARYEVVSNLVTQLSQRLQTPISVNVSNLQAHYNQQLALPFPVLTNLSPVQIARFEEQCSSLAGVDLEITSTRVYPFQNSAAHILGYVRISVDSVEGEDAYFSFRLPGYRGQVGLEAGHDKDLRGKAGAKSSIVNSQGYRQTENHWSPAEAGDNLVLTLDLELQRAVEQELRHSSPTEFAAAVVMEVHSGDILALASTPTFNPNHFVQGFPPGEWERISDTNRNAQINRATQGGYAPGSIFKTMVALAALEKGLDPAAIFNVEPNPAEPTKGVSYVGRHRRKVRDTAPPGDYNFRKALKLSSNAYFIRHGLWAGIERIVELGHRLHLGERTGLDTFQDKGGSFPTLETVRSDWHDEYTASVCIGQHPILVTPLQMAVMTCALANGGKVLVPRLVQRIEPQNSTLGKPPILFSAGQVRDELGVSKRSLSILKEAMLADVEDPDGTGKQAFLRDLRICGKTGTAQVEDSQGKLKSHNVWFISFAPYEQPRYAVVVMVEGGSSGGGDCAPIARDIYKAILQRERSNLNPTQPLAKAN
jgi:penicillin-binding protein 2